jgi:hypothetical protein
MRMMEKSFLADRTVKTGVIEPRDAEKEPGNGRE